MARFNVTFDGVTVLKNSSIVVGFVLADAAKPFKIVKMEASQQGKSDETKIPFQLKLVRLSTSGTGGVTVTPTRPNPNEGAISAVAKVAPNTPLSWTGAPTEVAASSEGIIGSWYVSPLSQNQEFFPAGWEPKAVAGGWIGVKVSNPDTTTDRLYSIVLYCEEM